MTKAEEMRKLTDQVNEQAKESRMVKHKKYAQKIIEGKVRFMARLGCSCANVKIKKNYSPMMMNEILIQKGFKVEESRKNARSIFKIKW